MTHKTFRDLTAYEKEQRSKIAPLLSEISKLTLEQAVLLQSAMNQMMWYSMHQVEEKLKINQTTEDNVEELV